MEQGLIVFLNGTSSSGKTSISMELKNQKEIPFHHLSIDDFCRNYNQFIDNTYPDMEPTRELEDHVVTDILFDPIISVYYATLNFFRKWV